MPIIKDGQTPLGRYVAPVVRDCSSGECVTRMMTLEEREHYGDPVPPSEWERRPSVISLSAGKPPARKMKFTDADDFRAKIKRERLRRNLDQVRMSTFCRQDKQWYGKIERGANKATPEAVELICRVFGWEVEEIWE